MRNRIRGFASATLLPVAITGFSLSLAAQQVPQQLQPPANEQLLLQVHAKGDQVYTCKADVEQYAWILKAPDAQLFGKDGKPFGRHFAGPSWEASDGSRVSGQAVANAPSPDANSIPWLLVKIVSNDGNGVLSRATSIQRPLFRRLSFLRSQVIPSLEATIDLLYGKRRSTCFTLPRITVCRWARDHSPMRTSM